MAAEKRYEKCSILMYPEIFRGYYENHQITETILGKLARELGFSYDLYLTLDAIDTASADNFVKSMSAKSKRTEVILLLDDSLNEVLGYSIDATRAPLLNEDFMHRVKSLVETSDAVTIDETYMTSSETASSVIIKKISPVEVEIQHPDRESDIFPYEVGILLINNELDNITCRLAVYLNDEPIYLPSSYYNTTSTRYKRSTSDSAEALEVLVLKIINELRDDELKYKLIDYHRSSRVNQDIIASYEEYNTLLRTMMKIPTIIDDRSCLDKLITDYDEFEKRYANLDDQKSSYIWRCTAMGEITIGSLVNTASKILKEVSAPAIEYYHIRELLGAYLSTHRIAAEIAQEKMN